jgi:uncharacterized membrane protein SirB2
MDIILYHISLLSMNKPQHYANHKTIDPVFHGVVFIGSTIGALLLLVGFVALLVVNSQDLPNLPWFMVCIFAGVLLIAIGLIFMAWKIRSYSTKNQDRIIRFEEGFRYYVLTGKQIDPTLNVKQLVALRFAPDEEFVDLCKKAAKTHMTPEAIKKAIINRKADHQRI